MKVSLSTSELAGELYDEWYNPTSDESKPIICIDRASEMTEFVSITVIWDKWNYVAPWIRSRIIWNVASSIKDSAWMVKVTRLSGYTKQEADDLKIEYKIVK